jgi:Fe-S-cluster containining protein
VSVEPKCVRRGACCRNNPGWFGPGEVEKAAEHMGLEIGDFVNKYLVIDHVMIGKLRVETFAPVKVDVDTGEPLEPTGNRISRVYHFMKGPCVFFDNDNPACKIHQVRPVECRHYLCTQPEELNLTKEQIGKMWLDSANEDS